MNFAEEIAYWYLRLNGFLPLTNFVLHRQPGQHSTSDADLIAVRFPHVSEQIGGQPDDWDERFKQWGVDLVGKTIGLIVEVKSGVWRENVLSERLNNRNWRVDCAIRRLGMFSPHEVAEVASKLEKHPIESLREYTIAKLLVGTNGSSNPAWHHLSIEDALEFIRWLIESIGTAS